MKVAINGIGIAGPTLAWWLRRFGHEPVLFERAPALRTGGYIIDFWGLGYDLAERMGILPTLLERGYKMRRLSIVAADGHEVAGFDVGMMRDALHDRFISVARADLAAAIFGACDGVRAEFGVSVAGIRQHPHGAIVTRSDGREEAFDVVVGADGLHSQVRALLFGADRDVETSLDCHVAAFRLANYPKRDALTYMSYNVPKRHAARFSLRNDETLALLICRSELLGGDPPRGGEKAALRRAFADMKWEVPDMLARLDDVEDLYFDRVSQIHLPRWSAGRGVLIGDAGACASLLAGEGTGLAMLEAYVLASELHHAGDNVERALAAFEAKLRPFVEAKQKGAVRFRGFFTPSTALGLAVRNVLVNAMAIPRVGRYLISRELRDNFVLPD